MHGHETQITIYSTSRIQMSADEYVNLNEVLKIEAKNRNFYF